LGVLPFQRYLAVLQRQPDFLNTALGVNFFQNKNAIKSKFGSTTNTNWYFMIKRTVAVSFNGVAFVSSPEIFLVSKETPLSIGT